MISKILKIAGMHCSSCAMLIEGDLEDRGIKASCSFARQSVNVEYDPEKITEDEIKKTIANSGYQVVDEK